jgi:hypothetical protein
MLLEAVDHLCFPIVIVEPSSLEVMQNSKPRGVILVRNCLTVKGAEDVLNKQFAFELSTSRETMYFIADTDKVLCRPLWQLLSHFPHLPVLESFLFLFVSLSEP